MSTCASYLCRTEHLQQTSGVARCSYLHPYTRKQWKNSVIYSSIYLQRENPQGDRQFDNLFSLNRTLYGLFLLTCKSTGSKRTLKRTHTSRAGLCFPGSYISAHVESHLSSHPVSRHLSGKVRCTILNVHRQFRNILAHLKLIIMMLFQSYWHHRVHAAARYSHTFLYTHDEPVIRPLLRGQPALYHEPQLPEKEDVATLTA